MSFMCTNDWHKYVFPPSTFCSSCGERKDGKITLANLPMMYTKNLTITHNITGQILIGDIELIDGRGLQFSGKTIPSDEMHDWFVKL